MPTVRLETATLAAQDHPAPDDEPPAQADEQEDQHEHEDQPQDNPPAEQTQQLSVAASPATESAPPTPDPAPSSSGTPDSDAPASDALASDAPDSDASASEAPDSDAPEPPPADLDLEREVTVVPGVPRYHNPQCLLIRFMGEDDLDKMTLAAARQVGCTPCRACLPDTPGAEPELSPAEPERQAEIALDVLPRRLGLRTRRLGGSRTRRARTRPGLDREHLDREHLAGDQPRVLGQGRDHIRVL
jgi:hypothetical protein